ncbi:MAG TPA: ABC transporter ATP-binding protein [Gammaproteobacteria bacterium]|jgi:iron complex transport system ATP-binding protein|nr:ABC transporter ATP-binding protein [Gammaproteobacteria bacterium]
MIHSLDINNLSIHRGNKIVISNLSMTINPGDCWAVLGPNGSGKTTLLQTLAGHIAPAAGEIKLNDTPLAGLSERRIAQQIGVLFQHSRYPFPQTVYEYCHAAHYPHQPLFAPRNDTHSTTTEHALDVMQLTSFADKNIQHLSGGEQRRAAIAALLIQSPRFFLLDEPSNHLDIPHQIHTLNLLLQLAENEGRAVMMALHDINLAQRYCNKILMIMSDGTVRHGMADEMLTAENLTQLYQHPIDAIRYGEQTYWMYESGRK